MTPLDDSKKEEVPDDDIMSANRFQDNEVSVVERRKSAQLDANPMLGTTLFVEIGRKVRSVDSTHLHCYKWSDTVLVGFG